MRLVTPDKSDPLPPEASLALAWTAPKLRAPLSMAFQLDRRLSRIVARTSEPMLGQMRLAWWRDAFGMNPADRPRGDAVLDELGGLWAGREAALVAMVDGWEVLLTAQPLDCGAAQAFADGRGAFFMALSADCPAAAHDRIAAAAARWALADAAAGVSGAEDRAMLVTAGLAQGEAARLPRDLRGLAVLDALAQRALRGGGRPLMAGRGAALTAMRAAIFLT